LASDITTCILQCVGKSPRIPGEFKVRPFSLQEARDVGLTSRALEGKKWKRIGAELYRWNELPEDHWLTLSAWRRALPPETVFAGASAAWLYGLDLEPTNPVEVVVPLSSGIRNRLGLKVRRSEIPPSELATVRGLRVTSLPLTIATLCQKRPPVEALVAIDMALGLGLTNPAALHKYADRAKGRHGVRRMRSLVPLAAAAESPMETRLRWLLIQAGLPSPEVQAELRDDEGRFLGRVDLCYPDVRLIVEYDGGNHRERLIEDDQRQNLLINGGYRILRFTGSDVYKHAGVVVAQVRAALDVS
jgi:hypothetical protein